MNIMIFGGLGQRPFPPGWTKEMMIAILGGGELDLSSSPPGPDARLTVVAVLGGIKVVVAQGTQVSVSGFSLLGGRTVTVAQRGNGPKISLNAWAFLGGIEVKEAGPEVTA